MKKSAVFLIFLCGAAWCVRISPKLDFGNDKAPDNNAKFRPSFQRSFNYGDEHKFQGVDVACTTGNCNVSGTDVVVHIRTNTNAHVNNLTEAVQDVPVIVGTKSDPYDLPPLPINNLIRNQRPQNEPRTNYNYPPERRDSNGFAFYPPYNEPNQSGNQFPLPQFTWNNPTRVNGAENYNPLEFKKVYFNSWTNSPTFGRLARGFSVDGANNPSSGPVCFCQYPQIQHY